MSTSLSHAHQRLIALDHLNLYQRDIWETMCESHESEQKALALRHRHTIDPSITRHQGQIERITSALSDLEQSSTPGKADRVTMYRAELRSYARQITHLKEERQHQKDILATRQQRDLNALSKMQMAQLTLVEKSPDPLGAAARITGERIKLYDTPEPTYQMKQPGFGRVVDRSTQHVLQPAQKQPEKKSEPRSSLDQAKHDLRQGKAPTHFDHVAQLKTKARKEFKQAANPFRRDQDLTRER